MPEEPPIPSAQSDNVGAELEKMVVSSEAFEKFDVDTDWMVQSVSS